MEVNPLESSELLSEGLNLMLLGMGTVFVFLTILVFVTSSMSSLVQKYVPVVLSPDKNNSTTDKIDDHRLLAVISAAIHSHRSKK